MNGLPGIAVLAWMTQQTAARCAERGPFASKGPCSTEARHQFDAELTGAAAEMAEAMAGLAPKATFQSPDLQQTELGLAKKAISRRQLFAA